MRSFVKDKFNSITDLVSPISQQNKTEKFVPLFVKINGSPDTTTGCTNTINSLVPSFQKDGSGHDHLPPGHAHRSRRFLRQLNPRETRARWPGCLYPVTRPGTPRL